MRRRTGEVTNILFTDTILRIPKEQAALLPNHTSPIVGDPDGYYIAQIDVFHQLHCLASVLFLLFASRVVCSFAEVDRT